MRYRVVDVFTDRPLAGNALCVVLDPCPEDRMQAIAREANLSETTFVTHRGDGEYSVRIFTPTVELPFAGHPTLGTAWVMGPGRWTQTTSDGRVPVTVDRGGAEMTQPDPEVRELDEPGVRTALRVDRVIGAWRAEAAGTGHLIAAVDEPIDVLRPHPDAAGELLDRHATATLALVRRLDGDTLHVRVLFRAVGVAEDPGTGSVAGPIGVITRGLWGLGPDLLIRQGDEIGRPSRIRVHAESGDLRVGGRVVLAAEGRWAC
jgi:trans-2,3-dihydro-3-hydroxyanthranilate isomerase